MLDCAAINTAIAAGTRVTARHSDLRRAGQPNPGAEVEVSEAFSNADHARVRVTARGYKGRFAVTDVVIHD